MENEKYHVQVHSEEAYECSEIDDFCWECGEDWSECMCSNGMPVAPKMAPDASPEFVFDDDELPF